MSSKITRLFILFIFLFSKLALAGVSQTEKEILIKSNQLSNGNEWIHKWNHFLPMEKWYGLKIVDDKVVSVNLNNNKLIGRLPIEATSLSYLKVLNLNSNMLYGEILANIGLLEFLDLSSNKPTGNISLSLCTLSNLKLLLLDKNILSAELLKNLWNLRLIKQPSLYESAFQWTLPLSLIELEMLKSLSLYSNRFSGSLESASGHLKI